MKHKPETSVLALSTLASVTGMCTGQLHPSPVQVIAQDGEVSWKTLDTCRGYGKKKCKKQVPKLINNISAFSHSFTLCDFAFRGIPVVSFLKFAIC